MAHKAQISPTALTIDDIDVAFGRPVELFQEILGPWSRIFTGGLPAPTGHRNNIRYIYDHLGISLLDHWTDQCLAQVTFHFAIQEKLPYSLAGTWNDPLWLHGDQVNSEAFARALVQDEDVFRHVLGKIYSTEYGLFHVSVDLAGRRSGKRKQEVVSLSVSLKNAGGK